MSSSARMDSARRRVRIARYVIGGTAAALFAGAGVAVRMAHPGTHGRHATSASALAAIPSEPSAFQNALGVSSSSDSSNSSSSISPAPAPSAPVVVQSSGS